MYNLYLFCLFMSGPVVRMAFIFNIFPGHLKLKNQETRTVSKERPIMAHHVINYVPGQWISTPALKKLTAACYRM